MSYCPTCPVNQKSFKAVQNGKQVGSSFEFTDQKSEFEFTRGRDINDYQG